MIGLDMNRIALSNNAPQSEPNQYSPRDFKQLQTFRVALQSIAPLQFDHQQSDDYSSVNAPVRCNSNRNLVWSAAVRFFTGARTGPQSIPARDMVNLRAASRSKC